MFQIQILLFLLFSSSCSLAKEVDARGTILIGKPEVVRDDDKCENSLTILFRHPTNCQEYFVSCDHHLNDKNGHFHKRSCEEGYFFDEMRKACSPADQVPCASSTSLCKEGQISKDPVDPSAFIECVGGAQKRGVCTPSGTIFDEASQTCVKPAIIIPSTNATSPRLPPSSSSSSLSLGLLKTMLLVMSSTSEGKFSPWMTKVKVPHPPHNVSNKLPEEGSLGFPPPPQNQDPYSSEDDQAWIWSNNQTDKILYYLAIAVTASGVLLGWFLMSMTIHRLCRLCRCRREEDNDNSIYLTEADEDFYRYNHNDKYVMSKL